MKRRQAIKQLAITTGGLLALPDWARAWTAGNLPALENPLPDRGILNAVIGAYIPESADLPGAVSLGVPDFVERMLADCYSKETTDNVKTALRFADSVAQRKYKQAFVALPQQQQQEILVQFEKGDDNAVRDAYKLLKQLTVQGFTNSEYVQTKFLEYEMAPGFYHGCVPVNQ
ncbi:MAG TPA: gluconate 2-dehydrogenase subunit 3 family protein [Saprospiraceae bacterium]|nr:gluconate 2-dehydrogenase subunit 3 family protein [Saprospiraceae bacterium]HPI08042.1 gluconate 2-dehydrogenase subunit 3 family protein [Saprospiraceae bacterium]